MARVANNLSVADLERLLVRRKMKLEALLRKRTRLERDLAAVEKQIRQLDGGPGGRASTRRRIRKRPQNEKSLRATVEEILGKSKKGYTLAEISDKALKSGYKSNSTDFKNVVYQCLYNTKEFMHDAETGRYKMAKK